MLNNLGMFAYFQGRWEEAVELYRGAGECSERAGTPGDVACADCNVGEILSDQGHLREADAYLRRAQRVWTATKEPHSVAFASLLLGRLALRDGRYRDALPLLESGMTDLHRFGVGEYKGFARALIAEAEAFAGDASRGLLLAEDELAGADPDVALLHRIAGIALLRLGRTDQAVRRLVDALDCARERGGEYDIAATVDVLAVLGVAQPEDVSERDAILARLRIVRLPRPQLDERSLGAGDGLLLSVRAS